MQDPNILTVKVEYSPIIEYFATVHPMSDALVSYLQQNTIAVSIEKGKLLVKPSTENKGYYFIVKGVLRGYIKEEGREITTWINEENEMVGPIRNLGLDFHIPTPEYLQALEDSELILMPYNVIEYVYSHFPESNIIGRMLMESNYRDAEQRAFICRIPAAEKRYRHFVATQGRLLSRIPLKYIASYLNMTLETMSRIRNKK